MPSYQVTFATPDGPHATRFTFDDDAPLEVQVPQIVEELRLRGIVIQGAPDDELAVLWNGAEVDLRRSPRDVGMLVARPIELRMRPRPVQSHTIVAAGYLSKAGYASVVLGASAGLVAWLVGLLLSDISALPLSYAALDVILALMFGASVGGAITAFEAYRRFRPVLGSGLMGMLAGAVGGILGAGAALSLKELAGSGAAYGTLFTLRMVAWMLVVSGTGLTLTLLESRNAARLGVTALATIGGGVFGAIVYNFPGPTMLWQGVALLTGGAAIGFAVVSWPLQAGRAFLEVEAIDRELVGVLAARTTVLTDQIQTPVGAVTRRGQLERPVAYAWFDGARVVVTPTESTVANGRGGARVGGAPLERAVLLGDGESIDVGDTRWRVHVLGGA